MDNGTQLVGLDLVHLNFWEVDFDDWPCCGLRGGGLGVHEDRVPDPVKFEKWGQ